MAMRKGRCRNFGNCDNADKHVMVELPETGDFNCPICGRQLEKFEAGTGVATKSPAILIAIVLAVAGAGYLAYKKFSSPDSGGGSGSKLTQGKNGREGEVRCRVNIWVGCAGGLAANGGLDTQPGSEFDKQGLKVSFKIIDDWTEGTAALASNNVDVMLTTTDVWAKDYATLKEKGFNGKAFLMVDWSRGADGVIGRDGIRRVEDLAGKSIAFAPYTPSHFLIWYGLANSGLNRNQRDTIMNKAIHTKDGIEPATLFAQGKVDSAVAWDPDMSDAVSKRAGSTKIYDTRIASKLIADILVVSDDFLREHPDTVTKFAIGWLKGVDYVKTDPSRAYNLIGGIKDFNMPADLAKTMLGGVLLSNYSENLAFFGNAGERTDYANIFGMAQDMYRELLQIKQRTPEIEATMTRQVLLALQNKVPAGSPETPPIYKPDVIKTQQVISEMHKTINFDVDSATISMDSKAQVDEIGGFMKSYENTVVEIVGNTDSSGDRNHNIVLSKHRADAVRDYLTSNYHFPRARIVTVGAGPDHPVDDNKTPEGREKNRRSDIKAFPNK
jgi:NitT/TauT family transport system substrate-binding protein